MVLNGSVNGHSRASAEVETLDRLPVGQTAIVESVQGDAEELIRLRVMGVCQGQGVHVLRPGSRMIVCVGGTRLGLDRRVAASVRVRAVDPSNPASVLRHIERVSAPAKGLKK